MTPILSRDVENCWIYKLSPAFLSENKKIFYWFMLY